MKRACVRSTRKEKKAVKGRALVSTDSHEFTVYALEGEREGGEGVH